jgi:hypothetical protein
VIIRKIVKWLLDGGHQGDWRLEVACFVAVGEWMTGALPEEYGSQIHVSEASLSQARYITLHEIKISFGIGSENSMATHSNRYQ